MKLKMRVVTKNGRARIVPVELPRLDVEVAVKKAVLSLGLDMSEVQEARIVPE
jgi:hypothetical protein